MSGSLELIHCVSITRNCFGERATAELHQTKVDEASTDFFRISNPSRQGQALAQDLSRLVVLPPIFVDVTDDPQYRAQAGKVLLRLENSPGGQAMPEGRLQPTHKRLCPAEFEQDIRLDRITTRAALKRRLKDLNRILDV